MRSTAACTCSAFYRIPSRDLIGALRGAPPAFELAMITYEDFEKVDIRVGQIVEVKDFPEARKPAFKLTIDFGAAIGVKESSAQLTALYGKEDLLGRREFPAEAHRAVHLRGANARRAGRTGRSRAAGTGSAGAA